MRFALPRFHGRCNRWRKGEGRGRRLSPLLFFYGIKFRRNENCCWKIDRPARVSPLQIELRFVLFFSSSLSLSIYLSLSLCNRVRKWVCVCSASSVHIVSSGVSWRNLYGNNQLTTPLNSEPEDGRLSRRALKTLASLHFSPHLGRF